MIPKGKCLSSLTRFPELRKPFRSMNQKVALSETIASTATIKLARIPDSEYFCTPIEDRFERLTRLARRALNVPVAAVTFINSERQWFKSVVGWAVSELHNDKSLCMITLAAGALTVVEDAAADARTAGHPLVAAGPQFRFYAGYPLSDERGHTVGTFCVLDQKPRRFRDADREALTDLANIAQRELASETLRTVHSELTSKLSVARREAIMDPLTHLWNRRGASVMIKSACERADKSGSRLGIALLDLDNFKRINDSYGHQIGDEVLRKAASRLVRCVRTHDVVCRLGGDEFLLILADCDVALATTIAERVRQGVTETSIPTRQGAIPLSVSVGLSLRDPGDTSDAEALIERADQGLMRSKSLGRNRVATID